MQINNNLYSEALRISKNPFYLKTNVLADKSNLPAYLRYRISRPIYKGIYKLFKLSHPETPWTSPASIVFFESALTRDMTGFEYGSGKSTLFFAKKLKHLVSVEHHEGWYQFVKNTLQERNLTNVDYHLIKPIDPEEKKGVTPDFFKAYNLKESDFEVSRAYFPYFEFIKTFPDNSFDFILVDGRARVECVLNAIPKLKPGGIMVLDNSERERYNLAHEVLQNWPRVYTTNGLTDTTIWFKPE